MTDSNQPGGGKPADPKPTVAPAGPQGQAPAGMSFTNHLFIWTLVILVGVIFGVGPSVADAFRQRRTKIQGTDIDESDAVRRMQTGQRLQRIIDPRGQGQQRFAAGDINEYARRILIERYADSLGLKPSGKVLDRLVDDFLAEKLPGNRPGTYQSAINEFRKNREGDVTIPELERFLAEDFANNAVAVRSVHVPPVPLAVGGQQARVGMFMYGQWMGGDRVEVDEATLSVTPFLKLDAIDDKDPALQSAYEELRGSRDPGVASRFEKPAVALVTVASVDLAPLIEQQQPTDAEVQAWYDAHREDYREPAKPEDKPADPAAAPPKPPEATYKPLADVKDAIVPKLKREQALRRAGELVEAFVGADEAATLEDQDPAVFRAAVEKAGFRIADVEVEAPRAGSTDLVLPGLGKLKQGERELGLFSRPPGFVSGAAEVAGDGDNPGTWVILRLNSRREAQARDLTDPEVLAAVKRHVAGRRAYADFLAAAEKLRAEAEEKGAGGLRAALESDAGKAAWPDAKVETHPMRALEDVRPPAKEVDGPAEPAKPVLAYAMPNAPVALAQADGPGESTSLRLLQVKSYQPATPMEGPMAKQTAELYRQCIGYYAQRQFSTDLQHKILE